MKMRFPVKLAVIPLLAAAFPAHASEDFSPPEEAECNESCLLGLITSYIDGLGVGDASEVPFADNHRIWINGRESNTQSDIWTAGAGWTYRHTVSDPSASQAVTLGVVREGETLAFIAVRITEQDGKIAESELLISREGDFSLFNPGDPREADPIFDAFIPVDRRQTREELEQVARGYFQGLIHSDSSRTSFHPDCNRLENNERTTNGSRIGSSSCSEGVRRFSYMRGFHDLRFPVIDPARGLVMTALFLDMPWQNRTIMVRGEPVEITPERNHLPRSLYLFELFKIEDGKIRRIEAVLRNEEFGTRLPFGGEAEEGPPLED